MRGRIGGIIVLMAAATLVGAPGAQAQYDCTGVSEANNTTLTTVTVATGLARPVFVTSPPGDTERVFIVEQAGYIRLLKSGQGPADWTTFLDIDTLVGSGGNEQGLLGLAFHPDYENNGLFYVNYTNNLGDTVIASFLRSPVDHDIGLAATQRIVLSVDQPESNHNGGWLDFGPDGYLYISLGDGGGGGDGHGACGNGQNNTSLLGKMLRIDVDLDPSNLVSDCFPNADFYKVPQDNPFATPGSGECDEIWLYGLRNAWRNSFDDLTGDFYLGDVGQNCWEEINMLPSSSTGGENMGWRQMEGTHCYNASQGCGAISAANCTPACNDPSLTDPVLDYSRSAGNCSVTGGYVYRGCRMPNYRGQYFYGDYCSGFINTITDAGTPSQAVQSVTSEIGVAFGLLTFGLDARGELYIGDDSPDVVLKVVPPLSALEVSGTGAADMLLLSKVTPWTWEDLSANSVYTLQAYRISRADFPSGLYDTGGVFHCIHNTISTDWPAGDPVDPSSGELFAYVVTALDSTPTLTSPGGVPERLISCP